MNDSVLDGDYDDPVAINPDVLASRQDIAALFDRLGQPEVPITAERIRQLAKRGRIPRRGSDEYGRTLYRIGDVAEAHAARHVRGWCLTQQTQVTH